MSLNAIINTSLTGLFTNQESLRVTASNIANVNTEGYKRLEVTREALVLQGETVGVGITGVTAVLDEFLDAAARTAFSGRQEFAAQSQLHERIQGLLGAPDSDSSLIARMDRVFSSMADLALAPADSLRRQAMLADMDSFLDFAVTLQSSFQALRTDASDQISEKIESANEILDRIHELNPLLVRQTSVGGETGGLEGQLGEALDQLSELVDIRVDRQGDGSVKVFTGSGQLLVDLSQNNMLVYNGPGTVEASTRFPSIQLFERDEVTGVPVGTGRDFEINLRSGRLRGLIDMRDGDLVELAESIGNLSAHVMDEFNRVHNAFTAVPPSNSLQSGRAVPLDGTSPPNFTGQVTFAVTDATLRVVNRVTIDFDAAPPATMNDLVTAVNAGLAGDGVMSFTGGILSFAAASGTDGVVIADDPNVPTDRGGRGFSHFFGMNDMITAKEQGIYNTGFLGVDDHNLGVGETISFSVRDAANREIDTVVITVTAANQTMDDMLTELNNVAGLGAFFNFSLDGQGAFSFNETASFSNLRLEVIADSTNMAGTGVNFTKAFGIGPNFLADAASDVQIREDLRNDPDGLSIGVFDLAVGIGSVALTAGDQRGALALQRLENLAIKFPSAGEIKATNVTMSAYVSRVLGSAGVMARRTENLEADNEALELELDRRRQDVTGVNLDQELADLVVFQNAYNAAARILSSVQELYESLLAAV